MIIDFHNHYYPPAYLADIRERGSHFRITEDEDGNPVLHSPGDYNVLVPGHRDLDFREKVLDAAGVGRQVITFTAPGTSQESPERAVELCRIVNDELAAATRRPSRRFSALGTLPMNAPEAAAVEVERVLGPLGLPGVMLFSNASGAPLYAERFRPVFDRVDEAGGVVYVHPTFPVGVEAMEQFMLMPLVGFLADTTLAAAGLVFAGVLERYRRISWVLAHSGGAIPYLAERLDRGYEAFPACRERCSVPPTEQLRGVYYDTVNFDEGCLRLALDFAGADHIVCGSDYPHQIGSIDRMKQSIAALDLAPHERSGIESGNAARILGLA